MTTKPLLLLVALTLCCCFASLHGRPGRGCHCLRTVSHPVPAHVISKIEVIPVSGYCRRIEVIVTRRNNSKVCINPNVKWLNDLLNILQTKGCGKGRTTCVHHRLFG